MATKSADIKEKWRQILKNNGILDPIAEVIVKDAMLRAEGGGSERQLITITFRNANLKPLNLFGKALTSNPSHTKLVKEVKAFEKEAVFLTKYVPAANEFCKRKGLGDNFVTDLYTKCYYGDDKLIVMENLVVNNGYTLLGKQDRHDWETAAISLTTLAKHHAISYAMIQESGDTDKFFKEYPTLDFEGFDHPAMRAMFEPWLKAALNTDITILQKTSVDGGKEALSKLTQYLPKTLMDDYTVALKCEADDIRVLCHGDYWYANMMYLKDPETGKILHHKALDLQVVRYNSPVVDVGFYLFTSVRTDLRQSRLRDLLQVYLETLNRVSKDLAHPINLSYEALLIQYRKRFRIGFWCSLITSYGPGMGLFKNVDMTKLDIGEWGALAKKLAEEWINENPDLVENMATEIVKVVKEYCELELN